MDKSTFDWKAGLDQLFDATVNQETIEEASELMVSVSSRNSRYHEECLFVLDSAIASAEAGEDVVIACINKSGYQVHDIASALELLRDFRSIYLEIFSKAHR